MTPQEQIDQLRKDLAALTQRINLNNFPTSQDFAKYSRFNTGLKVPHYSSAPATCEVGQVIEVSGKLYICSSANTWALVGTQT